MKIESKYNNFQNDEYMYKVNVICLTNAVAEDMKL